MFPLAYHTIRPRFIWYLAGSFIVGYTWGTDLATNLLTPTFWIQMIYWWIIANLWLYGINDLNDTDTDTLNTDKKGQQEQRLQTHQRAQLITLLSFSLILSLVYLIWLPTWPQRLLLILFLGLAWAYSAPPFRFKARPFVDSASNILYILPAILGYHQASLHWPTVNLIIALWAWTAAMHLFSAIPDIEPDAKAHLRTTAVTLGSTPSLWLCALLWTATASLVIFLPQLRPWSILALIYPLLPLLVLTNKFDIHRIYWWYPWINSLLGFLLFLIPFTQLIITN